MKKLPLILSLILYLLIFFVRYQQGGWDIKLDLFPQIRNSLDQRISQFLPSPQAELLSGVLLGQNKTLPIALKLNLRDTSTLHIVVASGQNLSMVAAFFLSLSGLIKRKYAIAFSLLAVVVYTLLTGVAVPVLRAAIMFSLASLAQIFGRQREGWWVLILTAALMLLVNPEWITDLSFQLSFLATFGVVVVSPILVGYLDKIPIIGQDLAVTLAAQLMVTPVIVQSFHQISFVSLAANALVLWTIPFMMTLGSVMLVLGTISGLLGQLIGIGVNVLLTYFIYVIKFFASLPFAWEYVGEQIWVVWVGYYLVLAGILIAIKNKTIDGRM
ncbi:MAG: ComEC/Rec2 family competence protein [Candidatus Daviesbacteria bacterium]|nr:ComEC/Rec2 family competence protein [Candidatus Daviesbacteria bacterium]